MTDSVYCGTVLCVQSWIILRHGITLSGQRMVKAVLPCWLNTILFEVFPQRSTFSSHKPSFS